MARGRPKDPTTNPARSHRSEVVKAPAELAIAKTPEPLALAAPDTIPAEAHPIWKVAVEELTALRTLHESDLPLIEMMVLSAYRHRQASAQLNQYGVLVKGQRGPMVNPLLKVEKETAATYQRLAETLGLTPVARLRLGLARLAGESILEGIDKELGITVHI